MPRADRIGIRERIHADGSVEIAPTLAEMKEAFRRLAGRGVDAVAICFLHSYRNPENELRAARCAPRRIFVSLSHRISPEYREFARFSPAVPNAVLCRAPTASESGNGSTPTDRSKLPPPWRR